MTVGEAVAEASLLVAVVVGSAVVDMPRKDDLVKGEEDEATAWCFRVWKVAGL